MSISSHKDTHNLKGFDQEGRSRLPEIKRRSEFVGVEHLDPLFEPLLHVPGFLEVIAPNKFEDWNEANTPAEVDGLNKVLINSRNILAAQLAVVGLNYFEKTEKAEKANILTNFRSKLLSKRDSMIDKINLIRSCYAVLQKNGWATLFDDNCEKRKNLLLAGVPFALREKYKGKSLDTINLSLNHDAIDKLNGDFDFWYSSFLNEVYDLVLFDNTQRNVKGKTGEEIKKEIKNTQQKLSEIKSKITDYIKYRSLFDLQEHIRKNMSQMTEAQSNFMRYWHSPENELLTMSAIYGDNLPDFSALFDKIDIRHIIEILYAETQCWLFDEFRSEIAYNGKVLSKFLKACTYQGNPERLRTFVDEEETKNSETYKALYYKYKAELEDRKYRLDGGRSTRRKHKKTNKKRKTNKRRKSYRKRY